MVQTSASTTREASLGDLQSIVAIHEAAFAGFFLTILGSGFLRELYRAFIVESDGICWVAEARLSTPRPEVTGFVAGAMRPQRFFRRLLYRRGIYFAAAALPGIFKRPLEVLPRVLSALWYRGDKPNGASRGALLSSLGVHPMAGRQGIGTVLVDAFCEGAALRGAREIYLITDGNNNDGANSFYEQAGFKLVSTWTRRGRTMNTYDRKTVTHAVHGQ
jgi:ribosomal protein S18 acetylase RimI-like enzyme